MVRLRVAGTAAGYVSWFHLEGWRDVTGTELVACSDDALSR